MNEQIEKIIVDLIFLIVGCALMAFSITGIMIPNGLGAGGVTGLTRVLQNFLFLNYSVIFYLLALAVVAVCWVTLGWKEVRKIIVVSVLFPSILMIFENIDFYLLEKKDIFLAAVYFGVINGIGMALILKRGYSLGGTDTLSKIIHKKSVPFVSVSQIMMFMDAVIIILSGIVYGRNIAMYALVAQLVYTKTIDFVLFGFGSTKVKIEIISLKHQEIEKYIIQEIIRGVTKYEITGGYSGEKKIILSCICTPRESMIIKSYISHIDEDAFINVMPINSVWGKGVGFDSLIEK